MTEPIDGNQFLITFEADIEVHHDEEKFQAWLAAQAATETQEDS